jgi:putative oxidoreductase
MSARRRRWVLRTFQICPRTGNRARRCTNQRGESAAQIPNSSPYALTLTRVTSQSNDPRWQRPGDAHDPLALTPARPASASLVDPEDDLPSATYAGDFETTTIPHYDVNGSNSVRVSGHGFGVIGGHQPLSFQPQSTGRHSAFGADGLDEVTEDTEEDDERVRAARRRGTQHLGLLILRVGLGAVLVAHGLRKLFGWWGGQGLTGFKNSLSDIGYQHADILTYIAAGGEIAAGLLLVLGLFTPLAAAGALAYLINTVLAGVSEQHKVQHAPEFFPFFLPDGHEYEIMLIVMAAAVILVGPGRYGFDAGRGWARRPFIGSFAALVVGIGAGIALWVFLNGVNPVA